MNVQEYISSGIVESYILGLADDADRIEFERMLAEHPEVRKAMEQFELALERYSIDSGTTPPAHLKSKILSTIELEAGMSTSNDGGGSVAPPVSSQIRELPRGGSRIGVMRVRKDYSRVLAAASVILLLISTALNFYFFSRYKEYNERYQALIASQTELASHNQILETEYTCTGNH